MIVKQKVKPKDKIYYVNNRELFESYVKWYANIDEDIMNGGTGELQIPPFIVDSMIKICTRTTFKPNFINYSFKDDLISDALYDCIRFAKKFNKNKSENPFSYLTTIAINAFLRRIDKEKKESYVKAKIISNTPVHDFFACIDSDDIELQQNFIEYMNENSVNLINNEPIALKRKRKKLEEKELLMIETSEPVDIDNSLEQFLNE